MFNKVAVETAGIWKCAGDYSGKVQTRMIVKEPGANKPIDSFSGMADGIDLWRCLKPTLYPPVYRSDFRSGLWVAIFSAVYAITVIYRMWQESAWAMSNLLEGLKRLGARE